MINEIDSLFNFSIRFVKKNPKELKNICPPYLVEPLDILLKKILNLFFITKKIRNDDDK